MASAKGSHSWVSMPPLGSAILTPLSLTLLWEAVIINPVSDWVFKDRRAANIPTLNTVDSRIDASALNPAVPYDNFTPEKKKNWWKDGVNNGESEDGYLEEVGNETRSWGLVIFDCRSCWFCCSIFTHRERERRMVCASLLFVFFESLHCLDFFLWAFFLKKVKFILKLFFIFWNYFDILILKINFLNFFFIFK